MIQLQAGETIEKPVEEVFEFLMDFGNTPKWQSGVIESKLVSEGPLRKGSKFDEVVKVGPWRMATTCEITEVEGSRRIVFRTTSSGPVEYGGEFVLERHERGTKLTVSGTMTLKGLWRLLEPLFASEIKKEPAVELRRLKGVLERSAGPQPRTATL
jgi:uncharacterized protein YndB with AHSA1/START domain